MKRYPANMADFMDMFPTEDACLEYLSIVRWPDGYKCLRCGKGDYWKKARGLFTCRACGYEASVLAGTLFQDTHKPLRLWFQATARMQLAAFAFPCWRTLLEKRSRRPFKRRLNQEASSARTGWPATAFCLTMVTSMFPASTRKPLRVTRRHWRTAWLPS